MTAIIEDIQWKVLPKQNEFISSWERELLFSGAFSAGKTIAILLKLINRAQHPRAREGLCRKELVRLKDTTLHTLLFGDGDLPPILPYDTYVHNKVEKTIHLNGGGDIFYFGVDDCLKLGSLRLTGCAIDECAQLNEKEWNYIIGRCSVKIAGLSMQIYGACNPEAPSHFLAPRFGITGEAILGTKVIMTRTSDNWHNSPEYMAHVNSFQGTAKKRWVEGLWIASDHMVYGNWSRDMKIDRHLQEGQEWKRIVIGHDVGCAEPNAFVVICEDEAGRIHIAEEHYKREMVPNEIVGAAKILDEKWHPEAFLVDPSSKGIIEQMKQEGLPARKANNDVATGLQVMRDQMVLGKDGFHRFTVSPSCEWFIKEIESYEIQEGTDKPIKKFDHTCFAAGTLIDGRPIETLRIGDPIRTHLDIGIVEAVGCHKDEIFELTTDDGMSKYLTEDHPFRTIDGRWLPAFSLIGEKICSTKNSTELNIIEMKILNGIRLQDIIGRLQDLIVTKNYTEQFGNSTMVQFQKDTLSITEMEILTTITSQTLNYLSQVSIAAGTKLERISESSVRLCSLILNMLQTILPRQVWLPKYSGNIKNMKLENVNNVMKDTRQMHRASRNSVAMLVKPHIEEYQEKMILSASVLFARLRSKLIDMARRYIAPRNVVTSTVVKFSPAGKAPVYSLTTSHGTYYANGCLVSNCDACRYGILYLKPPKKRPSSYPEYRIED